MKLTRIEQADNKLSEFVKHIKKDSDMPELPLSERKELLTRIDNENSNHEWRFVRLSVRVGSIVASICIIMAAGWYILSTSQPPELDYLKVMQSFTTTDDPSGKVQLVLSDNRQIPIEGEEAQIDYKEDGWVNINKNEKIVVDENIGDENPEFNQLIVPTGKRSMLTLNDGTRVWINYSTKLVYPVHFEKDKREIFVEGEIYLDVIPDSERPFIVHTGTVDVKVLGTQFNVSAYADRSELQVVLVSGEVEIHKNGTPKETLKPNQMFSCNEESQNCLITMVDVSEYIAWKDGYYTFYQQDLGIVLAKLSKYYNVQFIKDEKIKDFSCSGKLDLKNDLRKVLNTLEKTAPIEIRETSEREYSVNVKP